MARSRATERTALFVDHDSSIRPDAPRYVLTIDTLNWRRGRLRPDDHWCFVSWLTYHQWRLRDRLSINWLNRFGFGSPDNSVRARTTSDVYAISAFLGIGVRHSKRQGKKGHAACKN